MISDSRRPEPSSRVHAWLAAQPVDQLYLTAVTVGEIALGAALLQPGRKRVELEAWLDELVAEKFAGRILPYDAEAGRVFGNILATSRRLGRPTSVPDAQIAAIARLHDMPVATRDTTDFEPLGVRLINPWDDAAPAREQGL